MDDMETTELQKAYMLAEKLAGGRHGKLAQVPTDQRASEAAHASLVFDHFSVWQGEKGGPHAAMKLVALKGKFIVVLGERVGEIYAVQDKVPKKGEADLDPMMQEYVDKELSVSRIMRGESFGTYARSSSVDMSLEVPYFQKHEQIVRFMIFVDKGKADGSEKTNPMEDPLIMMISEGTPPIGFELVGTSSDQFISVGDTTKAIRD